VAESPKVSIRSEMKTGLRSILLIVGLLRSIVRSRDDV
jgi:hypothetical protein